LSRGTYPVAAPSLRADLHARIAANWWLKLFGITAFITVFFLGYFVLLRFPFFGVTVMPLTVVDRLITFQPWALGLYYSLWLYVSLPPALLRTRPEFYAYGWVAGALAVAGLTIFFFWPTSIPPTTGIEWSSHPGFAMLKRVDAAQNACPSLHVAFAVFSALWLDRALRTMPAGSGARVLSACWCLGIIYSTIATRQHVAVDVAAGAGLGLLAGLIRPAVLRESGGALRLQATGQ
jgi:membrane-associated phospholipid phosphatase